MSKIDDKLIQRFTEFCDKLNATQGTKNKVEILKTFTDIEPLVRRLFDDTTTGVTAASVKKYVDAGKPATPVATDILQTYDDLATRKLSGDAARGAVAWFVEQYGETAMKIFEKKPRIRLGQAVIKTVFTSSFTTFGVELAQEYTEVAVAKLVNPTMTEKIDGVRAITFYEDEVYMRTRTNKPITSADHILKEISALDFLRGYAVDGELDTGDFKNTVSKVRKQNVQNDKIIYKIFNVVRIDELRNPSPDNTIYSVRREIMERIKGEHLMVLPVFKYTKDAFDEFVKEIKLKGGEGVMIRGDVAYEPKRTKNLLKYKFIMDGEFRVTAVTIEDMAFPEAGGEVVKRALKNVIINYKGDPVHVGSGFSRDERLDFAKNPEQIMDKNILVEYQEPFVDKETGKNSLRCPIYKGVIGVERDF